MGRVEVRQKKADGEWDFPATPKTMLDLFIFYPPEMRRAGITGMVTVALTIDPSGRVKDIHVVRSTMREFEAPVIAASDKFQFLPARRGLVPVACMAEYDVLFSIRDDD